MYFRAIELVWFDLNSLKFAVMGPIGNKLALV